ncbi:MAG: hypothetical protein GX877_04225 [Bacteroidales bacterium]|nr:hypothetical protein [Bacteroidales bacterium]
MRKNIFQWLVATAALAVAFTSCARFPEENVRQVHEKMLEAHVKIIHLDTLQKTESGMYYTVLHKGTGKRNTDSAMVFVKETIRDLQYDIKASTEEVVARQLGTYSYANAYIPLLWQMGTYSILTGLEEMLFLMQEGEVRRIWLPYWLSNYIEGGTTENTNTMVYDLELVKVVDDMDRYQIDTLEAFRNKHYPGVDSLTKGFYKVTIVPGTGDSLKRGTSVGAYYVGKFLNGHVFDTNVADSAKQYRIYQSSKHYTVFDVTLPTAEEEDKDKGEEKTAIKGFVTCMQHMTYGEQAICFFHSDYGYKETGNPESSHGSYLGGGIPAYMPLYFWISVPPKD